MRIAHLNREQKKALIREQLKETPEKSNRQIAKDLGVSDPFVGKVRKQMEESGEVQTVSTLTGADGKQYPRQVDRKPVSVFNPSPREEQAIQNPAVVKRMGETNASNAQKAV